MDMLQQLWQSFQNLVHTRLDLSVWWVLVVSVAVVSLIIHFLRSRPIFKTLRIIFGFLPTLTHELGHALMCQVTGGRVRDIHMVMTNKKQAEEGAQGYAITQPKHRIGIILTGFAGYIMPGLIFVLGVTLIHYHLSLAYVLLLIFFMLYYFVKSKQKYIAFIPVTLIIILMINMVGVDSNGLQLVLNCILNIYFGLLLGEVVQSMIIMTQVHFTTHQDWDGSMLRRNSLIPATVWYALWMMWDAGVIYWIYRLFIYR